MANNSPTIVAASLSDDQLKKSIDSLVTHVDEAMKKMVQSTNNAVGEMEAKLKSLGNLKIDSGGSADGGASKRAKAQNEETAAVEKNVAARDKQIKKNQEVKMSFDQMQTALEKATRLPSEMRMPDMAKSARESFQAFYKGFNEQARKLDSLIKAEDNRLASAGLGRFSAETQAQLAKVDASIDQTRWKMNFLYQEEKRLNQEALRQKVGSVGFEQAWLKKDETKSARVREGERLIELEKERQRIIASDPTVQQLDRNIEQTRAKIQQLLADEKRLHSESLKQTVGSSEFERLWNQKYQARDQRIAEQEKLIQLEKERQSLVAVDPIRTQLANVDELRAKHEKVLGVMRDETTTNNKVVESQQQVTSSTQQTTQAAQRYTEEIRKQAQAIRESAEYKAGKFVTVQTPSGYDAVVHISDRVSIEDKLTQVYQQHIGQKSELNRIEQTGNEVAKETVSKEEAILDIEKRITAETEKRNNNKYVSPINYNDTYKSMIANTLGVKPEEIVDYDSKLKKLNERLKQLNASWNNLSSAEQHSPFGLTLRRDIQDLTRDIEKIRKEASRPISLRVVKELPEKTLDDIAYKIQQLQSYKRGLSITDPKQIAELNQANAEINRLQKDLNKYMGTAKQATEVNKALARSWNYMKNRLAFYFTVGAGTQFIKNLIEIRSEYELNERALGILIGSAERGTQIFNELSQMALVSPYTLIELSSAAKQLTAYDVAARDVVDTTRRLADMASAVGVPMERLTYALGQIKAYGYLNSRDNRMFANAGIPLVRQLADHYTELEGRLVSTADVYDRIKKKAVDYDTVMQVIYKMTDEGGQFFDFQAKMADTLKVQLANVTLAWNNMLNAMGEESQGVLVGFIGTLKQVFLHWKDIEHVLSELIVAFGAYKAYQIITTRLMGATAASLDAQVLAMKRNRAAMLEKQALTRKLTTDEQRQIAAQNQVTAADYRNALSGKQLTKQKALLLVALNKNNVQLKAAIVNMGLLTAQEAASITKGKALAIVFKSIGISIKSAALAIKAFAASMWPLLVVGALFELYHAWDSYGEHVKEVNKQAAEHAKESIDNIKEYLESDVTSALRDRLENGGKVENDAVGQKAWDEMREKIELSSSASNAFISNLMQINDINERLSTGFGYLDDIQRVAGVMQNLKDDAIDVSSTSLGGLFGEGLKDDLEDFINAYQKYVSLNENLRQSSVGEGYFNDQKKALEEFRGEVEKTTTSLYNIASREGFNTNEQREFFERAISEIVQAEEMGAKEARIFRIQAETEYYEYARAQLLNQLKYQQGAQRAATEERIHDLDKEFSANKALQESFFAWLAETQNRTVTQMMRGKTEEEIKQGEWLKGANAKWVEEMVRKFSKEYGVSFNDLHRLVLNANTWSINIPVYFHAIGQPLSDVQRDYEARTGKKFSSNPAINDAKTQVEIIDALKKKQKDLVNEMTTAEKAGGKYWENNKKRYQEENEALIADIHSYNALTDAEEQARSKAAKSSATTRKAQREAQSALQKAFKDELQLIDKLRSQYKKLTDTGVASGEALNMVTNQFSNSIAHINKVLGKNGLPLFDIKAFLGTSNPRMLLDLLQSQLDAAKTAKNVKPSEIKELELKISELRVDVKAYDTKKVVDGLNNELDKLKDEYELAIALDADPELGGLFTEMFNINTSEFPKTLQQMVEKTQNAVSKAINDVAKASGGKLGDFNVVKGNLENWAKENNIDITSYLFGKLKNAQEQIRKLIRSDFEETSKSWDKLLEKYAEYQYKQTKIAKESNQERLAFVKKFGEPEQIASATTLVAQIETEKDSEKKEILKQQLKNLIASISEDNKLLIQVSLAIDERELREQAKLSFEEFQKTPEWILATGELSEMSYRAINTLIEKIQDYRREAKNLSPKQIKDINKALRDLYKEQRKDNPFASIGNMIDRAKDRMSVYDEEIAKVEKQIEEATDAMETFIDVNGDGAEEQKNKLDKLIEKWKKLKEGQEEAGEIDASSWVSAINETIGAVKQAIGVFNDLAKAIGGVEENDLDKVFEVLEKAGEGAAIGAQIGGAYGAIIGGLAGAATSLIKIFVSASNERITEQIKNSERAVKRLENVYKSLEYTATNAYGAIESGAKRALRSNKELQLAQLERQLQLEESRDSKDQDEDKIIDLKGQINELRNDIKDVSKDIVNDLLGISSAGDGIEGMVSSMIDAFRNGEDVMKAFGDSFDEMVDNMILKLVVTQFMQRAWDNLLKNMENKEEQMLKKYSDAQAQAQAHYDDVRNYSDEELRKIIANEKYGFRYGLNYSALDKVSQEEIDAYRKAAEDALTNSADALNNASLEYTKWSLDYMNTEGRDYLTQYATMLKDSLGQWYTYGENKELELSSLRQGISGITEDTASALEAYMNIVSQRVFYNGSLLEQIRDAVVGMDMDVQTATQAQMLLQLQQSYQVQMSIQGILQGWSNASGMAVRVEMVS